MAEQPAENRLAAALVAAQLKMPAVAKDGVNPHFKSQFTTLDSLVSATRPVLNEHGLTINQFPAVSELGAPVLVTRLTHFSGEALEYTMPLLLGDRHDMQALGAAITYARRFAWAAALGIAAEADDDGEALRPAEPKKRQPRESRKTPVADDGKFISEAQRRRLFAIAKDAAVSNDQLAEIIRETTGEASTTTIPVDKYDQVVERLQAMEVPF